MQTFTEMKRIQKRLRHGEHCYRLYMCEEKTHSLVKLTPQQRLAFIKYIRIIRYNTTSCSSVAITLKGLAGLEQRTKKFSLNRLYFDAS